MVLLQMLRLFSKLEHNAADGTHKTTVVVTLTGTQTLTNKTLTTPTIGD